MSKRGSATAVLAGAAILALAGCGGVPKGVAPEVPRGTMASTASGATSATSGAARLPNARHSVTSTTGPRTSTGRDTGSGSFVKANSIPFPVAVGNTWVYKTTLGARVGRTTDRIVSAGPGQDGYKVTMSSTTDLPGTAAAVQPVYVFYPDGTIGYPVPPVNGVSVPGVVRWPDAAGLASGKIYRSVLQTQAGKANVTIQGFGTTSVKVPAGTYQASVVQTIIYAQGQTVEVTVWIAQGTGPVKTQVLIRAPGGTGLTTNELLSFTKAVSAIGDGS
jgi:hypothetical protein